MTATQFLKKGNVSITVIEPADYHYYQPAWTLVGANAYDFEKTKKKMADVMPSGVTWLKEYAEKLDPRHNKVVLRSGKEVEYDYLVLSPGSVSYTHLTLPTNACV